MRATNSGIVPYYRLPLEDLNGLITSIWIGPSSDVVQSKLALIVAMRRFNVQGFHIKESKVPYRD